MNPLKFESPLDGIARLDHLGVIRISGEDAAKFIHGQLTQDFALLGQDGARLAAFCSAKGRMQASFVGFKRPDGDILLVGSRDLIPATAKRLAMFVLRAKAKVTDATLEFALWGLAGSAINMVAGAARPAWSKVDMDDTSFIRLMPAMGVEREMAVTTLTATAPVGKPLDASVWAWGEVHSGVATLTGPLVDAFVPQMLNYESIGGVNFKKGCYPGQEVVARSQFRGTIKRRAYLCHSPTPLAPGDAVFTQGDLEQPIGTVVQSAPAPTGGYDALISAQTLAADGQTLHLGDTDATQLALLPLPYPLLDDI